MAVMERPLSAEPRLVRAQRTPVAPEQESDSLALAFSDKIRERQFHRPIDRHVCNALRLIDPPVCADALFASSRTVFSFSARLVARFAS